MRGFDTKTEGAFTWAWWWFISKLIRGRDHVLSRPISCVLLSTLLICGDAASQWSTPRTPYGQPDLQGTWTNATVTPFQRPAQLGAKQFFTAEEAAVFEKQRVEQGNVDRIEGERGASDLA